MFSLTDGEALEVFRGGLVTMFVVAVANKTLTTAQTYGLSATAAECRRRQPGPQPSPGCSLHRSRVAEAPRSLLRALADRRPISEPLRRPPRPWPPPGRPIRPVGIISIHGQGGCCDDVGWENRRKMGCFKIVEGCVKYRVGRRVRDDHFAVFAR